MEGGVIAGGASAAIADVAANNAPALALADNPMNWRRSNGPVPLLDGVLLFMDALDVNDQCVLLMRLSQILSNGAEFVVGDFHSR